MSSLFHNFEISESDLFLRGELDASGKTGGAVLRSPEWEPRRTKLALRARASQMPAGEGRDPSPGFSLALETTLSHKGRGYTECVARPGMTSGELVLRHMPLVHMIGRLLLAARRHPCRIRRAGYAARSELF